MINYAKLAHFTHLLKIVVGFLKEAFSPSFCVNCRIQDQYVKEFLCPECRQEFKVMQTLTCPKCGRINNSGIYCLNCRKNYSLNGIIYAAKFNGSVKEMIHYLKYNKYQTIAASLAKLVLKKLQISKVTKDSIIVPVPLHWSRYWQRGFNQSELIAKIISKNLKLEYISALKRIKNTAQQMRLKRQGRLENLKDAFKIENPELISGKNILLVDDVATTGATLNECAKVLKRAGAKKVWGVVVAKD